MRVGLIGGHSGRAGVLAGQGLHVVALGSGYPTEAGPPGVERIDRLEDLSAALDHPRLFFLDLPPGTEVDRVIDTAYVAMEPGDVVIDPTPSYWGDTLRRFRRMRHRSIYYVDVALLDDPPAALAAGDDRGVALALPALERLVPAGNAVRAGGAGAAHFALAVRAGVATAVGHALSEARQLLETYPNAPEPDEMAARLWPATPRPASAAAAWLLDDAIQLHAAIPLIAHAVMLELGAALDEHRTPETPPRVGGFIHPDDVL
jgi:6-phosphogluconate dehydrogenase